MLVFPRGASELCPTVSGVMSFTRGSARVQLVMKWLVEPPAQGCEGTEVLFHQTNSQRMMCISNEGSQPGKCYLSL